MLNDSIHRFMLKPRWYHLLLAIGLALLLWPQLLSNSTAYAQSSIGDHVWNDLNGNGIQDVDEADMSGITVTLYDRDDVQVAQTTTDGNGDYLFNTDTLRYYVHFSLPTNYAFSTPNQGSDDTVDSDVDTATGNTDEIDVRDGINTLDWDAGMFLAGDISGVVYEDTNGNGVQNVGEPGIMGVLVSLSGGFSMTTDANGAYDFTVPVGTYTITQTNLSGYTSTGAEAGTVGSSVTDNDHIQVTVAAGQSSAQNDFLDEPPASGNLITGQVRADTDSDGNFADADSGVQGVVVSLFTDGGGGNPTGNYLRMAQTDASGNYTLTHVTAGSYVIVETDLSDYRSTADTDGTNDNQIQVAMPGGSNSTGNDFLDQRDPEIEFCTYNLEVLVGSTFNVRNHLHVADESLPVDWSRVRFTYTELGANDPTVPADWNLNEFNSGQDVTTTLADSTAAANHGTGRFRVYVYRLGESDFDDHMTIRVDDKDDIADALCNGDPFDDLTFVIAGQVRADTDGDGNLADADSGIEAVTVELYADDGAGNPTGGVLQTKETDSSGYYTFTIVSAGTYVVVETDPTGYTSTADIDGPNINHIQATVNSTVGDSTGNNFLDEPPTPATIGGTVYDDLDGDGVQDGGEPGIVGVTVELSGGQSTTTDANGVYTFTVVAGSYTITETNPAGYTSTGSEPGTVGSTVVDDDHINVTVTAGQSSLENDFLDAQPGTITGNVCANNNGDGVCDVGEAAIASVTINLSDGQSTTTNGSGVYTFNVMPGTYTITETNPSGYTSVDDADGGDPDVISAVTVTSGQTVADRDFVDELSATPSASITKNLNTPESVFKASAISFTIRITNTGSVTITTLPLTDTYDLTYLAYDSVNGSTPSSLNNSDDGQIEWPDLTAQLGDLGPGDVFEVIVNFSARADTTGLAAQSPCTNAGESCNVATTSVTAGTVYTAADDVRIETEQKSNLGDWVWSDINADGLKNDGSTGINGVRVNLYLDGLNGNPTDNAIQAGEFVTYTITANDTGDAGADTAVGEAGFYNFSIADNHLYIVEIDSTNFDPSGPLEGYTYTGDNGAPTLYNGASPRPVNIGAGPVDEDNVDFPFWIPSTSVDLNKVLNGVSPVRTNTTVSFTIRITNTGAVTMTSIPLTDTYNTAYLSFVSASIAPSNTVNDGVLNWPDLTTSFGQDLGPNDAFEIVVEFLAMADTTTLPNGETINMATVFTETAEAPVQIINPTAVNLVEQSVLMVENAVEVSWQTVGESEIVGFVLHRQGPDGQLTQITTQPMVAQEAGQPLGASYTYLDESVTTGVAYSYVLEILSANDTSSYVMLGSVKRSRLIFLPLIGH